jgi:YYY domain-containing protein
MSEAFRWWLILQVVALPLLPLCLMLFARLPDRGYALSKPFGLLFLGFTFWFLNSIHVVPNSPAGILFCLFVLTAIAAAFAWAKVDDLLDWLRGHWHYVVGVEALLLVVFAVAVYLRSQVGHISGTEQPMDLMFLNATIRAENFPPQDPWLSGHTVAYYYFGYLIVGMVSQLANVPPDVAYNVGFGMIAALTFVGAAGLVYNLVQMRESTMPRETAAARSAPRVQQRRRRRQADAPVAATSDVGQLVLPDINWKPPLFAIAGALMLVVLGNLVFVFHFLSAYGIGGNSLYEWIDVQALTVDEPKSDWYPSDFFAFFNASRIYRLGGDDGRVITEFPMFSFLLGDLHPHVMALPFVLVAVALALTLYRSPEPLDITFWLQRPLALLAGAIVIGALAFLNTWDIATMAFVVVAAAFVSNFMRVRAFTVDLLVQIVSFALPLIVLAILLYLPFYVSFSSQADGIGAVVSNDRVSHPGTRPVHAFLFWGMLTVVVVPFVIVRLAAMRERINGVLVAVAFAPAIAVVFGWALLFLFQQATDNDKLEGAGGLASQIADRGSGWFTAIIIAAILAAALLALWLELTSNDGREEREGPIFVLGLVATGALLILGTEFFYVGDVFNSRMNTVFKLYYQAWTLLAVAGGFGLYYLFARWRHAFSGALNYRAVWGGAAALVLVGAALYSVGGTMNRLRPNGEPAGGNLRGLAHFQADELAAIEYLRGLADGQEFVIAEAVGNDYTLAGRISAATGLPAVLGWGGHEDQWRGSVEPRAGRFEDIVTLYQTNDMAEAQRIIDKYGLTFIYVGNLERNNYGAGIGKFQSMPVAFQSGAVTIYRAGGGGTEVSTGR